jgi:nucleoside-diphosphate-sugar epimerase
MSTVITEDALRIASFALPWDKLEGKTVLISGANGYVPAYFVHAFIKQNEMFNSEIKVAALCRSEERAKERFSDYIDRPDFELILQDVCDPVSYEKPVDFIIHAASPAGMLDRHKNCVDTYTANILGCLNLLELSRKNSCSRFLLVSSVDAYGDIRSLDRFTEDTQGSIDWLNPRSAYAMGKRSAETLCACYHAQYGVPAVIARPYQIFGPGIALDDGRLHIDFISQILKSDKIVLKSDGSARRSFLYITDAVLGMLFVMLNGLPCQAYNVSDEAGEASVLELAKLMSSVCQGRNIEIEFDMSQRSTPAVTQAPAASLGASEKLRELGWVPQYSLKEGAARMMKAYGL